MAKAPRTRKRAVKSAPVTTPIVVGLPRWTRGTVVQFHATGTQAIVTSDVTAALDEPVTLLIPEAGTYLSIPPTDARDFLEAL